MCKGVYTAAAGNSNEGTITKIVNDFFAARFCSNVLLFMRFES